MVVGQSEYLQRRHLARLHDLMKLPDPHIGPRLIWDIQVPSRVRSIGMANESSLRRDGRHGRIRPYGLVGLTDKLAIVPVGDPCTLGEIPQIPARRLRDIVLRNGVSVQALIVVAPSAR